MSASAPAKIVRITLPDGSSREYPAPVTPAEVAASIGAGLARAALAARIDGRVVDLSTPIESDVALSLLTASDPDSLEVLRHSCTHLMAQAIKRLRPNAMLEDGPPTEEGFWYDIKTEPTLTPDDFPAIEAEMQKIVKEALPIRRRVLSRDEARTLFTQRGEKYKLDLIERIPEGDTISTYEQGEFIDLCRGPHVPHTGVFKAFRLMAVAGAYWKGDAKNDQLCRVKGTAFHKKEDLEGHLKLLEEAKARDHRKLGRELGLFMHHEWAPGETFWLPRGRTMYRILANMMSQLWVEEGYQEVFTPMLFKADLFKTSGHWDHYRENMFLFKDADLEDYALKPMNCPSHMLIFRDTKRSYRELPLRIADPGVLHRNEASGTLAGLTRVRQFCQDDAHIFISQELIEAEISALIAMIKRVYQPFGLEFSKVLLSTRPEKFLGERETWDSAEAALEGALRASGMPYQINAGDGAFYGPKIDFILRDALKREWQTSTVQLDYQLPTRFGLKYVAKDNTEKTPIVIHRAIFGSFERFFGILVEHFAGAFPVWLCPEQVRVLTISEKTDAYAREVFGMLRRAGVRAGIDETGEKIGSKIREARLMRVPYLLVLGPEEETNRRVAVRFRGEDLGAMGLEEFLNRIAAEREVAF